MRLSFFATVGVMSSNETCQRTKFQQQLENFKAEATKSAELFLLTAG